MDIKARGTKAQAKLNFAKADKDSFTLKALVDLGEGFDVYKKMVTLSFGGAELSFTLSATGIGYSHSNRILLRYNKITKLWTLNANGNRGTWVEAWSAHGLTNDTVVSKSVTVPVVVFIGEEVFAADKSLHYTAKKDKSGSAK